MPRTGHKIGCQCAVCRKMSAAPAVIKAALPTFGSLTLGKLFEYRGQVYKKVSIATDNSSGTAINTTTPIGGQGAISILEDTIIKPR